jgi:hypothetical protein
MTQANQPSAAPGQLYQTDLAQTPLPELLVKIYRYRAPGVIECRRGDVIKRIYLDRGEIIFATTNQLTESLADKLMREGTITRQQYDESVQRLRVTGKRHGVTLMEMKILDAEQLAAAVREQIQEIVWSVFEWPDGTISFTPGREKHLEFVKIELAVPAAIMQGIRKIADAKSLIARLGSRTTLLARSAEPLPGVTLEADEQRLFDHIDGKRSLYDLVLVPPLPASDNARILYALYALQMIAIKQPVKVQIRTGSAANTVE